MTVSTVVAGLLPIMWSTRAGAEVMKPLATPVLGGMVSSLLHVLIVTPVIFYWIRARGLSHEVRPTSQTTRPISRRRGVIAGAAVLLIAAFAVLWYRHEHRGGAVRERDAGVVVQLVRAGDLDVVLLSADGTLHQGRNTFTIEFRRTG